MRKVIVKDKDGNVLKTYSSKAECYRDTGIYPLKIDEYFVNNKDIDGKYYCLENIPSNYTELECEYCGKKFFRSNRYLKDGDKYCSKECFLKSIQKPENTLICPICGKTFWRDSWSIRNSDVNYCSNECKNIVLSIYKGGKPLTRKFELSLKIVNDEYYYNGHKYIIIDYDHPYSIKTKFGNVIQEEMLIVERHLFILNENNTMIINNKKHLSKEYCIAHKNFIFDDNDLNNLIVLTIKDYNEILLNITNNYFKFKDYCIKYNLDYRTTYERYLYNKNNYNKSSDGIGWW